MSKFKNKGKRVVPQPPSGSLSDIVFMLLFFFMVTTTMREVEPPVQMRIPSATENEKITRKDLTTYIYVGKPDEANAGTQGTATRIYVNDKQINDLNVFAEFLEGEGNNVNSQTYAIKADEEVLMGTISDIKEVLRDWNALKIMYITKKKTE